MGNTERARVLLVDDNPRVRSFVRPALEDAGFECIEAEDGWTALEMIESEFPDLVVLDILMPEMDGLEVCKRIRRKGIRTPVVFLTIRDRTEYPETLVRAYELGGNAYITKREELKRLELRMGLRPTEVIERKSDVAELISLIRASLPQAEQIQEFDDYLRVDLARQQAQVKRKGQWQPVRLAPKEFSILALLVKSNGRPVGKGQLMDTAGVDGEGALQNQIWKLRQKLEPDPQNPRYIATYHKIGYRFGNPT